VTFRALARTSFLAGLLLSLQPDILHAQTVRDTVETRSGNYGIELSYEAVSGDQKAVSARFDASLVEYETPASWHQVSFTAAEVTIPQGDREPFHRSVGSGTMTHAFFTYSVPDDVGIREVHLAFLSGATIITEATVPLPGQREVMTVDYIAFAFIGLFALAAALLKFGARRASPPSRS
jgi:hypothetical protein